MIYSLSDSLYLGKGLLLSNSFIMDNQLPVASTPICSFAIPPILDHEASAVLSQNTNITLQSKLAQKRKVDAKRKKIVAENNLDLEYAALTPKEHIELMYVQYIQAAYMVRTQGAELVLAEKEKMKTYLYTLLAINNDLEKELLNVTTKVNTLEHRKLLAKLLDIQMDALKDADVVCSSVGDTSQLAQALDCKRHVLKTNNIAPPTEELEKVLKDIGACASVVSNEPAVNAENVKESSVISSVLADEAAVINDCNQFSEMAERLAIDQIGFDVGKIL